MSKDKKFLDLFLDKWATIKEPIRPSKEENHFYEHYVEKISKRENPRMLILGATPDFRDMAIKRGIIPVSADIMPEIFDAMKFWMEEEGEEEFIHSDWLELPEDRKYDIVITDGALNMLSRDLLFPYFEKISKLLKKEGLFVQRILITNASLDLEAYERAIKEYREYKHEMNIFLYTLYFKNCLQETMFPELTPTEIYEQKLFPYHTDEEIAEIREYLFFSRIYFPFQNELDDAITKFFKVVNLRRYDDIGIWDTGAQYVLKKK